jgi:pimeloyl-ACP methyl ester carboxylesterase
MTIKTLSIVITAIGSTVFTSQAIAQQGSQILYKTATVEKVKIFYREAGPKNAPNLVLLHGFPASSHQYRNLIPLLATSYHIIAPDYPGFGFSDAPSPMVFEYSFDHLAAVTDQLLDQLGLKRYSIYIQDYGAPVGLRLATKHPERVQAIISQNGNIYQEGLGAFWAEFFYPFWQNPTPANEAKVRQLLTSPYTQLQYSAGYNNPAAISPDGPTLDQARLDRPGNDAIQLTLFYDYRTNPPLYSSWQRYLRATQVPVLAIWGKNDPIFVAAGATAFRRDNRNAKVRLLNSGHFALEEYSTEIAKEIKEFLPGCLDDDYR